ncbi:MAG: hypothetical protein H6765_07305 [Candidatus Peribacteria bacterium]|nr:MAG: hypothetical protein H6765_07305 [Candidatus Peribacteria bacterium]
MDSNEVICSFLGTQVAQAELLNYLYNDFLPRRIAAGIKAKVLLGPGEENKKYATNDRKTLKQSKMIADEVFDMQTEINLYGPNKVSIALFSGDEMS